MRFHRIVPFAGAVVTLGLVATIAQAQSMSLELGKFEYLNSCAVCHGAEADGKGPLADMLNVTPPDLTSMQQGNGGVFPVSRVFATIEGADGLSAHGQREMPTWGQRYRERAAGDFDFAPGAASDYPKMRILALIEYLSQVQK